MAMKTRDHLQTMAYSYMEICQGEQPWIALGNFMNHWFEYNKNRRPELVAEPIVIPKLATLKLKRWSAYIAASVEYLCNRYGVPCPEWVHDPQFVLTKTWWTRDITNSPSVCIRLLKTTPEPFVRRNIYCGDRDWTNKWELGELAIKFREIRARRLAQANSLAPSANIPGHLIQ